MIHEAWWSWISFCLGSVRDFAPSPVPGRTPRCELWPVTRSDPPLRYHSQRHDALDGPGVAADVAVEDGHGHGWR